jgi:hypothetical protein
MPPLSLSSFPVHDRISRRRRCTPVEPRSVVDSSSVTTMFGKKATAKLAVIFSLCRWCLGSNSISWMGRMGGLPAGCRRGAKLRRCGSSSVVGRGELRPSMWESTAMIKSYCNGLAEGDGSFDLDRRGYIGSRGD